MAHLEYFSSEKLGLQEEVSKHPELMRLLANHPAAEFETKLAEIAAYCEVVLDGVYSPEAIDKLCDILTRKLYEKRTLIILQ